MTENNQELNENDLKMQAFQERMAQLVVEYETKVAELRVAYTILSQENEQLKAQGNAVPAPAKPAK